METHKTNWTLWIGALVLIGGIAWLMTSTASRPKIDISDLKPITMEVSEDEWIKGNKTASTTLIEYADFQCPGCASYFPALKQIYSEFGNDMRFVYRQFPLSMHFNARPAAQAAEAAGAQGKFWEMHDLIFTNQKKWEASPNAESIFTEYAKALQLDLEKFKTDYKSPATKAKIENSVQSAVKLGVNSTPTFYLNGKKLPQMRNFEEFKKTIKDALGK